MIGKQFTSTGPRFYTHYPTPEDGRYFEKTTFNQRFNDVVSPGQSVRGDKVHPNSWSYTIDYLERWRTVEGGFAKRTEWFPSTGRIPAWKAEGIVNFPTTEPTQPWDNRDAAYNGALSKLNDKVRGDLDLGVDLAEAGQTRRMIKSLDRVIKFAKVSRVGAGIADASRALANGWLEWQYGWRPLCSDVFAALDEGQNRILRQLKHLKARQTIKTDRAISSKADIESARGLDTSGHATGKQSCTIGVTLNIPESYCDPRRWSSLNPVSLAWEVIPYSFVVDWFVDVGSYIRNFETALLYGTQFDSGYVSELYVCDSWEVANGDYTTGDLEQGIIQVRSVRYDRHRIQFVRTRITSYPFPRRPTFKVDLGSQRLFSAAALLRQLLKR